MGLLTPPSLLPPSLPWVPMQSKLQPNIMTIEGPAAVEECIGFLDEATALPPLVLSDGLCHAAQVGRCTPTHPPTVMMHNLA